MFWRLKEIARISVGLGAGQLLPDSDLSFSVEFDFTSNHTNILRTPYALACHLKTLFTCQHICQGRTRSGPLLPHSLRFRAQRFLFAVSHTVFKQLQNHTSVSRSTNP